MVKLRVLLLTGVAMAAWSPCGSGQTLVEYGLGVAASGTAGAAAGGSGSSAIAGVFANLTRTLNSTNQAAGANATSQPAKGATTKVKTATAAQPATTVVGPEAAPAPAPAKPVVVYEDPAGIKAGMEQAEMFSRFGEPVMKVTTGQDAESLTYSSKDRVYEVEMRDGKVYSVQPKSKPRQASVVLLQ
jgi:hypothetical protein